MNIIEWVKGSRKMQQMEANQPVKTGMKMGTPEWREHMSEIGKIGGSRKVPKGFAIKGNAREAGRVGGSRSRRTK